MEFSEVFLIILLTPSLIVPYINGNTEVLYIIKYTNCYLLFSIISNIIINIIMIFFDYSCMQIFLSGLNQRDLMSGIATLIKNGYTQIT